MCKTALSAAKLKASLQELAELGSPVDLSVAATEVENEKVEIEQVGGIYDSKIFELEDRRVACMVDITVTNQTTRTIHVVDVELSTTWGDIQWNWLTPREIKFHDRSKRDCGYLAYQFPGKCGLELESDQVINHSLLVDRRLPSKRPLEGWLLGIGGPMPAKLRYGQWLDLRFAIIGADHAEYATTLHLRTERLEARTKIVKPRTSLFAQALEEAAMRPRDVTHTAQSS
jgi:hypothetical protein